MSKIHEGTIEYATTERFSALGYSMLRGTELVSTGERSSTKEWLLEGRLRRQIQLLNPLLPLEAVEQAVRTVSRPPHPTLIQNNRWFHSLLTDGVEVEYRDPSSGERRGGRAWLVDMENPQANDFLVTQQTVFSGLSGKYFQTDLTIFLNGMPVAMIELKDPTDERATLRKAFNQFERYKRTVPEVFISNVVLVISDGMSTRAGSITSDFQRFMRWRPDDGGHPTVEAIVRGLFEPSRFIEYLRTCVVFEESSRGDIIKKIAGYHQFRAVRKARERVLRALKDSDNPSTSTEDGRGDGRGGVIWHTQGSGKSLSMLMLAGALIREPRMANPTIVMITDRNDLDGQLFDTFSDGRALLRQMPIQADSRNHLKELLDRAVGGVIFSTIQKFSEAHGAISERSNIVVIADEAHRSQYGFLDGGARWMRDALPNATFVGFTGTPLDRDDKNTFHVFGDEAVDVYDIHQAVEDGATKPLYYESRIVKLSIDDEAVTDAEEHVAEVARAEKLGLEIETPVRVRVEDLVGAPERIKRLAAFIVDHWEKRRAVMEGKAMVVTMSRDIAARLYTAIKELRPEWHNADDEAGMMKVVMTGSTEDSEHIRSHVRTKAARQRLAERFKNPHDDFRLVIVVDMWLTGFDCPPAHTMYLDRPLGGHTLMQAIARVNRVFGDKPGGLIVDLIGLFDQLEEAMATYTRSGGSGEMVRKVQDQAVPAMQAVFEKLQDFFHGYDYTAALGVDPETVTEEYLNALDHVLKQPDGRKRFLTLVKELSMAFALVVPRPEADEIVDHLLVFQQLSAVIRKELAEDNGDDGEDGTNNQQKVDVAVRQLIGGAVRANEVIDLFSQKGLEHGKLGILSEEFLSGIAGMEQKNLALATLERILRGQIRVVERTNIVQSKKFREALEEALLRYSAKAITTSEVIDRLLEIANRMRAASERGEDLGLSDEEIAFYDALAENESAREVMQDEVLFSIAQELTRIVRKMPKLDWSERESVRATLRSRVRRLLSRYGYPPDLAENATRLVLQQVEKSTANAV